MSVPGTLIAPTMSPTFAAAVIVITSDMLTRSCATAVAWSPVVATSMSVVGPVPVIVHVITIVDVDRRMTVVMTVVRMAVVGVTIITVMIYVQVIRRPANRKCRRHAPEKPISKVVIVGVRVVVEWVGTWVVVINRMLRIDNNSLRFVIGYVDDFFINRFNLDDVAIFCYGLVLITLEIADGICLVAEGFNGSDNRGLLRNDGLAKFPGPVDIVIHHFDYFRIIE